jgi:hypothetical protein
MLNVAYEDVKDIRSGDLFVVNGKRYQLLKKTTTAVSVRRYYWFDELFDRFMRIVDSANL